MGLNLGVLLVGGLLDGQTDPISVQIVGVEEQSLAFPGSKEVTQGDRNVDFRG